MRTTTIAAASVVERQGVYIRTLLTVEWFEAVSDQLVLCCLETTCQATLRSAAIHVLENLSGTP